MGIVGFGRMGEAIARGLKTLGVELCTCDPSEERREVARALDIAVEETCSQVASRSETLFLAVKPQVFPQVAKELEGRVNHCIVVSVMAGIGTGRLKKDLSIDRVVRVMPNTPALIGEGAIAYCTSGSFSEEEIEGLERMLSVLGRVVPVPEAYMDAVTGLSGSGPAYLFLFLEALEDAGVRVGLPRDVARALAVQTVKGSVLLLERTSQPPRELINAVTSPGGTTIAALHALEKGGFKGLIMDAVLRATERSKELGNG